MTADFATILGFVSMTALKLCAFLPYQTEPLLLIQHTSRENCSREIFLIVFPPIKRVLP